MVKEIKAGLFDLCVGTIGWGVTCYTVAKVAYAIGKWKGKQETAKKIQVVFVKNGKIIDDTEES